MAWILLDDNVCTHPKIIAAGPEAFQAWVASLALATRYLTDGYVPNSAIATCVARPDVRRVKRVRSKLTSVGLWEEVDGGIRIHDYLQYQPSAAKIKLARQAANRRKEAWRERRSKGVPAMTGNASGTAFSTGSGTRSERFPLPYKEVQEASTKTRRASAVCTQPAAARLEGAPPAPESSPDASNRRDAPARSDLEALTAHVQRIEPTISREDATMRAQFLLSAGVRPPQNAAQGSERFASV